MNKLLEQLKERFGPEEGLRIYITITPSILADFKKILSKAAPGEMVSETYRFEDKTGSVELKGSRNASGEMKIEGTLK